MLPSASVYGPLISRLSSPLSSENDEWPSSLSLNLSFTDRRAMEQLFDSEGFKVKFALKYVELDDPVSKPDWIKNIEDFLLAAPPKSAKLVKPSPRSSS